MINESCLIILDYVRNWDNLSWVSIPSYANSEVVTVWDMLPICVAASLPPDRRSQH